MPTLETVSTEDALVEISPPTWDAKWNEQIDAIMAQKDRWPQQSQPGEFLYPWQFQEREDSSRTFVTKNGHVVYQYFNRRYGLIKTMVGVGANSWFFEKSYTEFYHNSSLHRSTWTKLPHGLSWSGHFGSDKLLWFFKISNDKTHNPNGGNVVSSFIPAGVNRSYVATQSDIARFPTFERQQALAILLSNAIVEFEARRG